MDETKKSNFREFYFDLNKRRDIKKEEVTVKSAEIKDPIPYVNKQIDKIITEIKQETDCKIHDNRQCVHCGSHINSFGMKKCVFCGGDLDDVEIPVKTAEGMVEFWSKKMHCPYCGSEKYDLEELFFTYTCRECHGKWTWDKKTMVQEFKSCSSSVTIKRRFRINMSQ